MISTANRRDTYPEVHWWPTGVKYAGARSVGWDAILV